MNLSLLLIAFTLAYIFCSEIWFRLRPSLYEQIMRGHVVPSSPLIVKQTRAFEWSVVDSMGNVVLTSCNPGRARDVARQLNMIRASV